MPANIGIPGLLLIAVVVLVLFGRGKVSSLMGEVGKGITAFKRGVREGAEEVERTADAATDRAAITADRTADDREAAAVRARAEAEAARTNRAQAMRDVTPADDNHP